jgi:hypothetical protein
MAGKSATELREAMIVKTLSKRSKVDLCTHGINKKFCSFCEAKKKRTKAPASKDSASEQPPQATPTV